MFDVIEMIGDAPITCQGIILVARADADIVAVALSYAGHMHVSHNEFIESARLKIMRMIHLDVCRLRWTTTRKNY